MGRPPLKLEGQRFGRLTALEYLGSKRWRCQCDCGQIVHTLGALLRRGSSASCGCLQREQLSGRRRSHGASYPPTPEYTAWRAMKERCTNPNHQAFRNYGGRGIIMNPRWFESFESFLADVGPRPSSLHSIDRINNELGYEPDNCRWVLPSVQHSNKRTNRRLTFNGQTRTAIEWARFLNVPKHQIENRLKRGWSVEDTLTKPLSVRHSHRR